MVAGDDMGSRIVSITGTGRAQHLRALKKLSTLCFSIISFKKGASYTTEHYKRTWRVGHNLGRADVSWKSWRGREEGMDAGKRSPGP